MEADLVSTFFQEQYLGQNKKKQHNLTDIDRLRVQSLRLCLAGLALAESAVCQLHLTCCCL